MAPIFILCCDFCTKVDILFPLLNPKYFTDRTEDSYPHAFGLGFFVSRLQTIKPVPKNQNEIK